MVWRCRFIRNLPKASWVGRLSDNYGLFFVSSSIHEESTSQSFLWPFSSCAIAGCFCKRLIWQSSKELSCLVHVPDILWCPVQYIRQPPRLNCVFTHLISLSRNNFHLYPVSGFELVKPSSRRFKFLIANICNYSCFKASKWISLNVTLDPYNQAKKQRFGYKIHTPVKI